MRRYFVEYELSSDDELVDATLPGQPFEFEEGKGNIHPLLERALVGRPVNEEFEISLDPTLAFGEVDPSLKVSIAKKKLDPAFHDLRPGDFFEAEDPKKLLRRFRVMQNFTERLVVDGNHPLAGKILHLKARIIKITD